MPTLVHLVSGQNAPNYLAAKQLNAGKNIFLFTSPGSKNQKDWLKDTLGGESDELPIDAFHYDQIVSQCTAVIEQHKNERLVLNFTGGTKIMSVAAFNIFYNAGLECLYVDSEHREPRLIIYQRGDDAVEHKQTVTLPFVEYLKLSGHTILPPEKKDLGNGKERFKDFLRTSFTTCSKLLVKVAGEENKKKKNIPYTKTDGDSVFERKQHLAYLKVVKKGKTIFEGKLKGYDAANYLTGGWVEELVAENMKASRIFSDVQSNVLIKQRKGKQDTKSKKNEIDAVGMIGSNPFIVECKSGAITQMQVYKLKALKDLFGGRYARTVFVTYFDVPDEIRQKAEDFDIEIVRLELFEQFLQKIIAERKPNIHLS